MLNKNFWLQPLTAEMLSYILKAKKDMLLPVYDFFGVSWDEFCKVAKVKMLIPGMDIRMANGALDILVLQINEKKDIEDTLSKQFGTAILYSGIYYTNVAPDEFPDSGD